MSNIIKVLKTTLKGTLSTTGLTFTVQKMQDSKEVEVVDADFGGDFVVVMEQGSSIEMIRCTGITQSGSDNTAVIAIKATTGRHLNPKSPWTGGVTGLAFTSGASVIVSNDPYTMSRLANIDRANTFSLLQTFTLMPKSSDVPTDADHLINKTYGDALVLGSLTTLNVVVPATAGETVAAGELVYYNTTDKEWKLCDADSAATVENVLLAIAQGAGTNGNAITGGVLLRGMDSNQTGMTAGDIMYASNTAGAIASSAGTKEVAVGVAKEATKLYFNPRFNQMITEDQQDALAGNLTTPSSANKYATQAGLQKGAEIYAADAEANDTYVITLSPVPASLYTGMVIHFKANTANTGEATLNVNGKGAKIIKKLKDQTLATGDIEAGQIITVIYDGTYFQMQSQIASTSFPATVANPLNLNTVDYNMPSSDGSASQVLETDGAGALNWVDAPYYRLVASDTLVVSADTERYNNDSVTYTKKKEVLVNTHGTVRIKFDLKLGAGVQTSAYGRIYVNGVAVGTERNTSETTYQNYSEDIAVEAGDLVQLYLKCANTGAGEDFYAYAQNFRFYYTKTVDNEYTINTN